MQKLLRLKPDEIEALNQQSIIKGEEFECETSKFTGYVCDVHNFEEVNKAYENGRFHNIDARHIICACRIPGTKVTESIDYHDNDEQGAAQKLMSFIDEANLRSRAIFVARKYDGTHIGPQRFEYIIKAAKSAVNYKPYNVKEGEYQFSWSKSKGTKSKSNKHDCNATGGSDTDQQTSDEEIILTQQEKQNSNRWADISPSPPTQCAPRKASNIHCLSGCPIPPR